MRGEGRVGKREREKEERRERGREREKKRGGEGKHINDGGSSSCNHLSGVL